MFFKTPRVNSFFSHGSPRAHRSFPAYGDDGFSGVIGSVVTNAAGIYSAPFSWEGGRPAVLSALSAPILFVATCGYGPRINPFT